jgi:hypothetical protein
MQILQGSGDQRLPQLVLMQVAQQYQLAQEALA